jgi:hypothetical protein
MEYYINSAGMVFNPQPIADILAFTVYRHRLALFDIVDSQRVSAFPENGTSRSYLSSWI